MDEIKSIEFKIPEKIISDHSGYEFLSSISLSTWNMSNNEIGLNFSDTILFKENLCSPLGALIAGLKKRKNKIKFIGLKENIAAVFKNNGFLKLVSPQSKIPHSTLFSTIEFKKFSLKDTLNFQEYINDHLIAIEHFPHISELLKKKINKSIWEIFNNAHTHGKCEYVYTCGQYSTDEMKLFFTISDMGITIRKNVNDYFKSGNDLSGKDAILWAVEEGNTTKKGGIPGGLGLSLIREFLMLNEGGMQIISSNGYWEEKNGRIFVNTFKNRFLGTIVNFEFNLSDKKSYILSSEIDPKNVF